VDASRHKAWAALLGLLLACSDAHGAEIDPAKAAAVIAAYVRHIAALTEWPEADADTNGPIRIGVFGDDPNGVMAPIRARTESPGGLSAQGRPIKLLSLAPPDTDHADLDLALTCAMLFFAEDAGPTWDRLRPAVAERPIVTLSEMTGFADRGGMIEFAIDVGSGKVQIKVNLESMRAAGITLSARFLALDSVILVGAPEEAR